MFQPIDVLLSVVLKYLYEGLILFPLYVCGHMVYTAK